MKTKSSHQALTSWFVVLAITIVPTSHVIAANNNAAPAGKITLQSEQGVQHRIPESRQNFEKGKKMLRDYGVPFDPEILNNLNWRKLLKPHFDTMDDMQTTKRPGRFLRGVYLADALILPGEVEIQGDVFIVVRSLIFEDTVCPYINGSGDLYLYMIEPHHSRVKTSQINRRQFQNEKARYSLSDLTTLEFAAMKSGVAGPPLTVAGYPIKKISAGYGYFQCGFTINLDGADRPGVGTTGVTPGPASPNLATGDPGASGDCGGHPDGYTGGSGLEGAIGTKGGPGGEGEQGGDGGSIDCSIACGTTGVFNWSARGGQGQKGGQGGYGGQGGTGGKGGTGGTGAACCGQNPTELGKGGMGGRGGVGGEGGEGGDGGTGGKGGNGGDITVSAPATASINHIESKGISGAGGEGSTAGQGGVGGPGGDPGAGGSGSCGTNSQNLGTLGVGPVGNSGAKAGKAGGQNQNQEVNEGTYNRSTINCPSDNSDYCGIGAACNPTFFDLWGCNGSWDCSSCECLWGSPILFDVQGNGFSLTSAANGVRFDLKGNGVSFQWGWTAQGSDDAFLALDRSGNGTIDNGLELFGNFTPQPDPPPGEYRNGFLALAELDKSANGGNGNGKLDTGDSIFSSLRLWQDTNHNGFSEPGELHSLSEFRIATIDLDYKESKKVDEFGNKFTYRAKVKDTKGGNVGSWAWDVFFVREH